MIRRAVLLVVLLAAVVPVYGGATIVDYPLPKTVNGKPIDIKAGPDGHVWFLDYATGALCRINDDNSITDFRSPGGISTFTSGFDGAIWFASEGTKRIRRLDPYTGEITGDIYSSSISYWEEMITGPDGNFWMTGGCDGIQRVTPTGVIRQVDVSQDGCAYDLTVGPDGNIWATEHYGNRIARVTQNLQLTEFQVPQMIYPDDIVAGPDGNVWFTSNYGGFHRVTPSGQMTLFVGSSSSFGHITTGSDGNLWVGGGNHIARYATTGAIIADYPLAANVDIYEITSGPDGNIYAADYNGTIVKVTMAGNVSYIQAKTKAGDPVGTVLGADGNLWFTEKSANKVGKITPAGAITEYSLPSVNTLPTNIVAGSDGALWFVESAADQIGRVNTSGTVTEYVLPAGSGLTDLTVGSDGALWITAKTTNKIIRLTTGGTPTYYPLPAGRTGPTAITTGSDGKVWFAMDGGSIGRLGTGGDYADFASGAGYDYYAIKDLALDPVTGKIFFIHASNVSSIDTAGTVTPYVNVVTGPNAQIIGASDGSLWISNQANIIHVAGGQATLFPVSYANGLAIGSDGNIWFAEEFVSRIGKLMTRFEAVAVNNCAASNAAFTGTVARVRDFAPPASGLGYTATIDWGDGTATTPGTIVANGDWFDVNGTHTYASNGLHVLKVTIADADAPSDSVTIIAEIRSQLANAQITFPQACLNAPIIAQATDAGPDALYQWTVPGVILEKNGRTIKFSSPDATINVSVIIQKPNWCDVTVSTQVSPSNCQVPHVTMVSNGPAVAGGNASVTVTAKDQYDVVMPGYAGTVHFTSSDPNAVLPANYTFVAGDNGVHTFNNLQFTTVGTKTVTVNDVADSLSTASVNITVGPGAASAMSLVGNGFQHAGMPYTVTLTLRDAYQNLATTYTGTVHFSSSAGNAILPANYTFTGGDAGVHAFSVTMPSTGAPTLTVTDVANGSLTTTITLNVLPSLLYPDFNGDGKSDLLWRNSLLGTNSIWYMNDTMLTSSNSTQTVADLNWKIEAASDFNGNGICDIVWRNASTGANAIWFMNGATLLYANDLLTVTDQQWQIEASGDVNGDGYTDLIWHNHTNGLVTAWIMNGSQVVRALDIAYASEPTNWHVAAAGDFDGDGDLDLVFRNTANGRNCIWHLQNQQIAFATDLPAETNQSWKIVAAGDYTSDGKPDLVWRNYQNGMNVIWRMDGSTLAAGIQTSGNNDASMTVVGPK